MRRIRTENQEDKNDPENKANKAPRRVVEKSQWDNLNDTLQARWRAKPAADKGYMPVDLR